MKYFWKILGFMVILSVIGIGIRIIFFPVKVANTVLNSAGDVVDKTLDAGNVIFNYEHFFDMYQSYGRYKENIDSVNSSMAQFAKDYGNDRSKWARDTRQTYEDMRNEVIGYQRMMADIKARYNADSQKLNRKIFKSNSLPYELN